MGSDDRVSVVDELLVILAVFNDGVISSSSGLLANVLDAMNTDHIRLRQNRYKWLSLGQSGLKSNMYRGSEKMSRRELRLRTNTLA